MLLGFGIHLRGYLLIQRASSRVRLQLRRALGEVRAAGLVAGVVGLLRVKLLEATAARVWWKLPLMLLEPLHVCCVVVTECLMVAGLDSLVVGLSGVVSERLVGLVLMLTWLRLTARSVIGGLELLPFKLWWVGQGTWKMTVLLLLLRG